ncbi:DHH family phosphoesterase [Fredinandcohnia sp. 179-A 10B2 NHS]|uniref:DHH family phosphoesterase n=1 Tax=Fredinandcohnia sp. 179-A 10B2 NHS TaxID=3235176 RepID=UPI0039A1B1AC
MIKLFSDSDLDGVGCGLVAKLAFGESVDVSYCSYRNLNERVEKYIENPEHNHAQVYITDLAVNEKNEKELQKRYKAGNHIQMVDHHKTAMHFNDYEWGFVKAEYETGKKTCATSLYYEFLLERNLIKQSKGLEEFIELVRLYDTWEWETENRIEAKRLNDLFFIIGLEQFESEMLERLKNATDTFRLTDAEEFLLDTEDKKIERYINSKNRQIVQTFIEDYCVGIVHGEQYISELGNALAKLNPHLDLIAILNVGTKKIGLRTIYDEVDVSEFAKRFGGGGHPKASGCSMGETAFELFVKNAFPLYAIRQDAPQNELNVKENESGVLFVNRKGEKSLVFLGQENQWRVVHEKKMLEPTFANFADVERFVKRNHASGLAFDNELLSYLGEILKKDESTLRKNFQESLLSLKNHFS